MQNNVGKYEFNFVETLGKLIIIVFQQNYIYIVIFHATLQRTLSDPVSPSKFSHE